MSSKGKHSSDLLKYVTEVNKEVFNFSWKIQKLDSLPPGIIFQSPLFSSSRDKEKRTWCLEISCVQNYLNCFACLIHSQIINSNVSIEIEILDEENAIIGEMHSSWQTVSKGTKIGDLSMYWEDMITNELITIIWKVNVIECKLESIERKVPCNAFGEVLFLSKKHADVLFIVDGKEFKAHKAILAATSLVFEAMFAHKMNEAITSKVEIKDFSYKTFEKAMKYIYTGVLKDIDDVYLDLIEFSEKYGLLNLKALCEESVYSHVNIENVIDVLIFADEHSAEHLKTYAKEVIKNKKSEVISKTSGWKKLESKSHLLMELWATNF